MAYTATQLITGAYYAAGIVSREFETVSGSQISDGLLWLNDILAEKRVDDGMIPYETTYKFNSVTGVEKYFIPNLVQIDTLVFYFDQVRYAMQYTKRNQYFGGPRVENINSLPFNWYWERQKGGGNLYIYFKPDKNYPFEVHGTFDIPPITQLQQDLSASVTVANLGVPILYGGTFNATLSPGQLVVNGVDLQGTYAGIAPLVHYINTGIIPGVSASIVINDFVLSSTTEPPVPIYVQTNGYPPNGTRFIGNVAAATTVNLDASYLNGPNNDGIGATLYANSFGALIVDGYTVNIGDRILVQSQTIPQYNGSYVLTQLGTVSSIWELTRTTNYDQPIEINVGDLFTAINGSFYGGRTFIQNSIVNYIGYGRDAIEFTDFFSSISFSNFSTLENPLYEVFNALGFDQFYLTYLRYALADRICSEYNYDTPQNVIRQLSKYESWINKKSRIIDLQMQKTSTLQKQYGYNWAFINLGKGWTRPS
jgi:hypothetical protein